MTKSQLETINHTELVGLVKSLLKVDISRVTSKIDCIEALMNMRAPPKQNSRIDGMVGVLFCFVQKNWKYLSLPCNGMCFRCSDAEVVHCYTLNEDIIAIEENTILTGGHKMADFEEKRNALVKRALELGCPEGAIAKMDVPGLETFVQMVEDQMSVGAKEVPTEDKGEDTNGAEAKQAEGPGIDSADKLLKDIASIKKEVSAVKKEVLAVKNAVTFLINKVHGPVNQDDFYKMKFEAPMSPEDIAKLAATGGGKKTPAGPMQVPGFQDQKWDKPPE